MNVFARHKMVGRADVFRALYERNIIPHDYEFYSRIQVNEAFVNTIPFELFHLATGSSLLGLSFHAITRKVGGQLLEEEELSLTQCGSVLTTLKG